jgi:Na+-driven multidrug efflux pump
MIQRALQSGWTAAVYSAALSGLIGAVIAVFPGLWANLFTDSESIRAACRTYLQIVGPFYAFFGLALCLYFASQGAGRVAWPVIASVVRVLLIVVGCVLLSGGSSPRPAHFFWLIAAGMVTQALISGMAIRLGAWTRGR